MIVTDTALEVLAGVVERSHASEDSAVRIVSRTDGWTIEIDEPRAEDETFEYGERTVLILDARVAMTLQDSTLDVRETPDGPRLRLR